MENPLATQGPAPWATCQIRQRPRPRMQVSALPLGLDGLYTGELRCCNAQCTDSKMVQKNGAQSVDAIRWRPIVVQAESSVPSRCLAEIACRVPGARGVLMDRWARDGHAVTSTLEPSKACLCVCTVWCLVSTVAPSTISFTAFSYDHRYVIHTVDVNRTARCAASMAWSSSALC